VTETFKLDSIPGNTSFSLLQFTGGPAYVVYLDKVLTSQSNPYKAFKNSDQATKYANALSLILFFGDCAIMHPHFPLAELVTAVALGRPLGSPTIALDRLISSDVGKPSQNDVQSTAGI
jgi:type III secretory pathway component EscR